MYYPPYAVYHSTLNPKSRNSKIRVLIFAYDMRSQLTDADISNINGGNWVAHHSYYDNGDMAYRTIQSDNQNFSYNGYSLTNADGNALDYDENGNMTNGVGATLVYNWDNKLRSGQKDGNSISLKYDPAGNRIQKNSTANGNRKYIVDIVACPERSRGSDLPVILLELDPNMAIKKTYVYANGEILAQHKGDHTESRYFYLHDRLGSVRQIISTSGNVVRNYTYQPFGGTIESSGLFIITNAFMFTGQYYDTEISQYYLRARQYDPYISRFTSRDPVSGKFEEPLTLHKYLYCGNNPINFVDPQGLWEMETHRSFGRLGSGQAPDPFDYARLDIDYPPWKIDLDPLEYTWLHFMPRNEIFGLLQEGVRDGDSQFFGYMMHSWQDSYVHYDRYGSDPGGHARDRTAPDNPRDPYNVRHNCFNRTNTTTLIWEDIYIRNNMDTAISEGWLPDNYTPSSAWLSMGPRIYICGDDNELVDIVDY
jgi:RHS repeat-associated protein